jgi:uncharacterized protein YfaT (DUF1175 family)
MPGACKPEKGAKVVLFLAAPESLRRRCQHEGRWRDMTGMSPVPQPPALSAALLRTIRKEWLNREGQRREVIGAAVLACLASRLTPVLRKS